MAASTSLTPTKRLGLGRRPRPSLSAPADYTQAPPLPPPSSLQSDIAMLARKTSYNQLTQNSLAQLNDPSYGAGDRSQAARSGGGVDVGDVVDTPGGLYGVVKFIGSVRGKAGSFVGVELEGELAGRGKNDGAVEGVRYFTTAQPMSGIFVPVARTSKRLSTDSMMDPPTPTFGQLPPPNGPTALLPPSLTPGRHRGSGADSPERRNFSSQPKTPIRPSLSRPESPMRRAQTPGTGARPSLIPPSTPRVSSAMGGRMGAPSPGPMPNKMSFSQRVRSGSVATSETSGSGRPGTATGGQRIAQTPRSAYGVGLKQPKSSVALRSGSAIGMRQDNNFGAIPRSGSSMSHRPDHDSFQGYEQRHSQRNHERSSIDSSGDTATSLRAQLEQKDSQLREQAQQLAEMESSLAELQDLVSPGLMSPQPSEYGDADTAQLRALLREKNEKIQNLTMEFDAHRADFRSTIDTLEMASSETERVYESRVNAMHNEIRDLTARNSDVESVARQLRQLEELVQELEEGLEDARRGEAEARGEAEFLRGELERNREELRREKEKSAASVAAAAVTKLRAPPPPAEELDKKDDEIRGLKAIIHSLSRDSITADDPPTPLQSEIMALQTEISAKGAREIELEREIAGLKQRRSARTSTVSDTALPGADKPWRRNRAASTRATPLDTTPIVPAKKEEVELTPIESDADSTVPWCEICETAGHDILTCTNMFGSGAGGPASAGPKGDSTAVQAAESENSSPIVPRNDAAIGATLTGEAKETERERKKSFHLPTLPPMLDDLKDAEPPKIEERPSLGGGAGSYGSLGGDGPLAGKETGKIEMEKWCAVCERDGHDSVDCPLDAF